MLNCELLGTGAMHYSCAGTATAQNVNECLSVEEHKIKQGKCRLPGMVGEAWPVLLEGAGKVLSTK